MKKSILLITLTFLFGLAYCKNDLPKKYNFHPRILNFTTYEFKVYLEKRLENGAKKGVGQTLKSNGHVYLPSQFDNIAGTKENTQYPPVQNTYYSNGENFYRLKITKEMVLGNPTILLNSRIVHGATTDSQPHMKFLVILTLLIC